MNGTPPVRGPIQEPPNSPKKFGVLPVVAIGLWVFFLLSVGPILLANTDEESAPTTASGPSTACVNGAEAKAHNDRAAQALADAQEAVDAGDVAAGVSHMREAADGYRATAEAFAAANPDVAQHLYQASTLIGQAADAAEQGRRAVASARMLDTAETLMQANTALNSSTAQAC